MKRYIETVIDKLPVATSEMKPKCFPGRYPTRVWVAFSDDEVYLGKPSVQLVRKINSTVLRKGYPEVIEFDRVAKFFGFAKGNVCGNQDYLALYHPNLPLSFDGATRLHWFGMPFRTLRVGAHSFYTTYPASNNASLKQFIQQRLNQSPPAVQPKVPQPKSPRPRRAEFPKYAAWAIAIEKWKAENTEYLAWKAKQKAGYSPIDASFF